MPPVRRPQPRLFRRGNGEPGTGLAEEEAVVPEWDLAEGWAKLNKESTIKGTISGLDQRITLWPIPLSEIQRNKDVVWQNNPGY